MREWLRNKNALAWIFLTVAGGLHVLDEALHDFLSFYNPLVQDLRERLGFLPMPTFSQGLWLGGLIAAIIISFLLTPIVARGRKVIRVVVTAISIVMILNALGHIFGSVYFGYLLPGFISSPLLLIAAVWMTKRGLGRQGWAASQISRVAG